MDNWGSGEVSWWRFTVRSGEMDWDKEITFFISFTSYIRRPQGSCEHFQFLKGACQFLDVKFWRLLWFQDKWRNLLRASCTQLQIKEKVWLNFISCFLFLLTSLPSTLNAESKICRNSRGYCLVFDRYLVNTHMKVLHIQLLCVVVIFKIYQLIKRIMYLMNKHEQTTFEIGSSKGFSIPIWPKWLVCTTNSILSLWWMRNHFMSWWLALAIALLFGQFTYPSKLTQVDQGRKQATNFVPESILWRVRELAVIYPYPRDSRSKVSCIIPAVSSFPASTSNALVPLSTAVWECDQF